MAEVPPTDRPDEVPQPRTARHIVTLAGGRGGVGRSLIATNLAVYLAQVGKRVVLVDADLGGACLHTLLGIEGEQASLAHLIDRKADQLSSLVIETPVFNLGLLSGQGDRFGVANLRPTQKERLLQQLRALDADFVLVDAGAGTSFNVLDLFLVADFGILIAVPEPTSVEALHRFVKCAVIRLVRRELGLRNEPGKTLEDTVSSLGGLPGPLELRDALAGEHPDLARLVESARDRVRPRLVVNRIKVRADLDLGAGLRTVAAHILGVGLDYLGYIESDDAVWLAARKRRPLIVESPGSGAAKDIERIVRRILALESPDRQRPGAGPMRPVESLSHYDLFEVGPGASDEEIRRAYRKVKEIYSSDSLATYGLVNDDARRRMLDLIERAYAVLGDPGRRHAYDLALFPDGRPSPEPRPVREVTEAAPASPPPPPANAIGIELTPETEFTGELLRRVREAQGVDLRDVTARIKVNPAYLQAIEEENFAALPAMVYTRGFVTELAKFLKLDAQQVTKTYLRRFKRYLEETGQAEP